MRAIRIPSYFIITTLLLLCNIAIGGDSPLVKAEKDTYNYGETIKVNFWGSPGKEDDWICIVAADAPVDDAGDYQHMPKGLSQGIIIFNPPKPGKYEVRAYYNYRKNGYLISSRYSFSVIGDSEYEKAQSERQALMERKIDPGDPLEAIVPTEKGLVYIYREASFASSGFDVQIKADGKSIVFMKNSSYFAYYTPSGYVNFMSGVIRDNIPNSKNETESVVELIKTINIKPGYVNFLRIRMVAMPFWTLFIDHVPHEEGSRSIKSNKLKFLNE